MDIEDVVNTYSDQLYRIAYSYVKDQQAAEEVVQDVFYKFYNTHAQFEGLAHLKTYLTRMVINRSYDYLRSWKNKRDVIFEVFQGKRRGVDQDVLQMSESESLLQSVLALPVKYREALILYYYEDLQVKEIADMLGTTESTIKSRLQRGRAQLKSSLKETDWEVLKDGQSI